jgi:hypothetical protein
VRKRSTASFFTFAFLIFNSSAYCRKLYYSRGLDWLSTFRTFAIDAMAGNHQGAMKIVQVCAVEPHGLLPAPTQTFHPGRIAQDNLRLAFIFFQKDFDPLVVAWGIKNLNCRFTAALHGDSPEKQTYSIRVS